MKDLLPFIRKKSVSSKLISRDQCLFLFAEYNTGLMDESV